MGRIKQLDGLRGICALMLVFFHFGFEDTLFTSNFLVRRADLFVDFFFVLSGFVITLNYGEIHFDKVKLNLFIKKRLIRLYPLLVYTVLVYLLLAIILNSYNPESDSTFKPMSSLFLRTLDSLTFLNSTPLLGSTNGMNFPSWSISAEMISYLIFGTLMLMRRINQRIGFAFLIVGAICFFIFKEEYLFLGDFGFIRGIYCFSIGYFTLIYYRYKQMKTNLFEIPILILILVSFYYSRSNLDYQIFILIIPWIFSLTIYVYANSNGIITGILQSNFFQNMGEISYSIYLNHALVLILTQSLFFKVLKLPKSEGWVLFCLLLSVFLTVVYSKVTYSLVERTIGRRFEKILFSNSDLQT